MISQEITTQLQQKFPQLDTVAPSLFATIEHEANEILTRLKTTPPYMEEHIQEGNRQFQAMMEQAMQHLRI